MRHKVKQPGCRRWCNPHHLHHIVTALTQTRTPGSAPQCASNPTWSNLLGTCLLRSAAQCVRIAQQRAGSRLASSRQEPLTGRPPASRAAGARPPHCLPPALSCLPTLTGRPPGSCAAAACPPPWGSASAAAPGRRCATPAGPAMMEAPAQVMEKMPTKASTERHLWRLFGAAEADGCSHLPRLCAGADAGNGCLCGYNAARGRQPLQNARGEAKNTHSGTRAHHKLLLHTRPPICA